MLTPLGEQQVDVVGHQSVGKNFYAQCFLELEQVNVFTWEEGVTK
jgi:hypothetical protein